MSPARVAASSAPVARVLPLLGLEHLDRYFDYLVDSEQDAEAQPGVRVKIRFHGRKVDGLLLERVAASEFSGQLAWLEKVISPEVVLPERMRRLVETLAQRYAGVRSDVIRSALPPRIAAAEKADTTTPWEELGTAEEPDLSCWARYEHGQSFVDAVDAGQVARAAWQVPPGANWPAELAALATRVAIGGGGVLIVVPDQRDVQRLESALREHVAAAQVTTLYSSLGPQARYRRFLAALHGQARIVVGTRSAAFAPVRNLKLAVLMHAGDTSLVDQLQPYINAREVLTTRSMQEGASLVIGGHSRTAEAQLMVATGWAHDLVASRLVIARTAPRITATGNDYEKSRDRHAGYARLPDVAFRAARAALERGEPVLVHVPRRGYIPTLACGNCRAPARCRHCNGPLEIPEDAGERGGVPTCRWCGRPDSRHVCGECGSPRLRAVVLGSERTAEELGRAFPGVRVIHSGGARVLDSVPAKPALVVATPGAAPWVEGDGGPAGYGAALLLDTWAELGRQDLRAGEEALEHWASVATLVVPERRGGEVVITADATIPQVRSLVGWQMVAAARRELAERGEVRFPPTVHMAAVDAPSAALERFLDTADLPDGAELLGPVDVPSGHRLPGEYDRAKEGEPQRMLIRVPLGPRLALGLALQRALTARALRGEDLPLRVQVDPVGIG